MDHDVIIIGGGIAGLACARTLHAAGVDFALFEGEERVGGRIRTDTLDGFLLDRGFQVLQTAYPEAHSLLDYAALGLHRFPPGVTIRSEGAFHTLADPRRAPRHILSTLRAPVGNTADRLRMVRLARKVGQGTLAELFDRPETDARTFLREQGFTEGFIQRFFVPFLAGACLDPAIETSSRVLSYLFRMFSQGDAALPGAGMEAIPRQIAASLPSEAIRLGQEVATVHDGQVVLAGGGRYSARMIVLATEAPETERLMGFTRRTRSVGETCHYFSAGHPPLEPPFLILNGEGTGTINNVAMPSMVAPGYAPGSQVLIAAVALGDGARQEDPAPVHRELVSWFGAQARDWRHLRSYRIEHALPVQQPPTSNPFTVPPPAGARLRICGEYQSVPGIQWALLSGRLAAEAVLRDLG